MSAHFRSYASAIAVMALLCWCSVALAQPHTVLLHAFGRGTDAATPAGTLVADRQGNLYGTSLAGGAFDRGTVFQLSPPSAPGAPWNERVLYNFPEGSNGAFPQAPLYVDTRGIVYGVTGQGGGNQGTVFALSPPSDLCASWSFSVLYAFPGGVGGAYPAAGLTAGPQGQMYGTTFAGGANDQGTVYELLPPAIAGAAWSAVVIHSFSQSVDGSGPAAPLLVDAQGAVYGTTGTGPGTALGSVFALSPPATEGDAWSETLLYSFAGGNDGSRPVGRLIEDTQGNLYGATFGGGTAGFGTVFELSPPAAVGGAWSKATLHNFTVAFLPGPDGGQPLDGLTMDVQGNLYGTTTQGGLAGHGTVFRLSPPASPGGPWAQSIPSALANARFGRAPLGGVLIDANGNLFGTAGSSGAGHFGTAFEVMP